MIKTQAEVALMSNEDIDKAVNENLNLAMKLGDEPLPEDVKEYHKMLKDEYQIREAAGLHEIPCMICTNPDVAYYDIIKQFCSDMRKITKNICVNHRINFNDKQMEFFDKR